MSIKTIKYLTQDEIKRLMNAISTYQTNDQAYEQLTHYLRKRNIAIFIIAYRHGLRASEVGMLRRDDVNLNTGRIRIERLKNSQSGEYPMQPDEIKAIKEWLRQRDDANPYLFPSQQGLPINRRMILYLTKRYGALAGIPKDKRYFHILKHSIATHLLDAGADIRFVQDWIGHKNIQNTVVYTHLSNRFREEQARKIFSSPFMVGFDESIPVSSNNESIPVSSNNESLICKSCGFPLTERDFNSKYFVYLCENWGCRRYREPQQTRLKITYEPERVQCPSSEQRLVSV